MAHTIILRFPAGFEELALHNSSMCMGNKDSDDSSMSIELKRKASMCGTIPVLKVNSTRTSVKSEVGSGFNGCFWLISL